MALRNAGMKARLAAAESRYRALAPWLLFREEDGVLILPPNRVYKVGGSGPALLSWLSKGGSLSRIPGLDETRLSEIEAFLLDLEAASSGSSPRLERVPYDFAFTRLPVLGELALTYACNAACAFCYAGCGKAEGEAAQRSGQAVGSDSAEAGVEQPCRRGPIDAGKRELDTREAKRIIRLFREEAKIPFFSFTGGEPLLRDDLEELASEARSIGLRTNLITNGTLATSRRAASLKRSGIDTAQVSLESPYPATHDALCGLEGGWERTVAGIRALVAAGISVQTNTTLTARNRAGLEELPAFLKTLGVSRFSMNLFIPAGRGSDAIGDAAEPREAAELRGQDESCGSGDGLGAAEGRGLLVSYSEAGAVVDSVRRAAYREGLTFFWYSPTPYCIYNPVAWGLGNKSCAALDGLVHVNPYGEILPCSSWAEPMGSLREKSFREIWFQERSLWFKEKRFAPEECSGCASFTACQGACPLYWKAVGRAELKGKGNSSPARREPALTSGETREEL